MRTLSIERARSIVDGAEEYFSRRAMDSNYFVPFRHAGAIDRLEALHAMLIAIAEYRRSLPPSDASARSDFDKHIRLSKSVVLGIILDSDAPPEERAECGKVESIDSFVQFLESADPYAATFWHDVYQRLGLQQAAVVVSKQKRWWQVW